MSYTLAYKGAEIDEILGRAATGGALDTAIAAKQDALTFDAVPTEGSTNPAESGGIYDAIQAGGAAALAAFATDSVSGDVVSFPDGADGIPVKAFTGSIIPAQSGSGDPAPDNVRPISGWTGASLFRMGANLWDESWELGNYDNTTGAPVAVNNQIRSANAKPISVQPNTDYTFSVGTARIAQVFWYSASGTFISRTANASDKFFTATSPAGAYQMKFQFAQAYGTTYLGDCIISQDGQTILLDFGQTVYAGTLTALGGGLWKVQPTHAYRELTGTESFSTYSSVPNSVSLALTGVTPNIKASADIISDRYKHQSISAGDGINVGSSALYIRDTVNCANATGYKAYLAAQYAAGTPVQICYELATLPDPITITGEDLQTLLGANTVWTDVGAITGMTYRADTALYIQKLIGGGGTLQTLSMASPSPSLSLGRVGVLAEQEEAEPEQTEEEAEQLEQTEEPEQTEEA